MLTKLQTRQTGFGLVEMMIGLIITLVILAAAGNVMLSSLTSNRDNIRMSRLDQELRQTMTMISRDLRRATSWDTAADVPRVSLSDALTLSATSGTVTVTSRNPDTSTSNLGIVGARAVGGTLVYNNGTTLYRGTVTEYNSGSNSFTVNIATAWPATSTDTHGVPAGSWGILRPQSGVTISGNCILFAFDTDLTGTFTTSSPNEFFGYRYDSTEQAVEIANSSTDTCVSTGWQNLTDESIFRITAFTVTNNSPATVTNSGITVAVREYTISITGQLISDTTVVRTLQETIRVRNDHLS